MSYPIISDNCDYSQYVKDRLPRHSRRGYSFIAANCSSVVLLTISTAMA